MALEQWLLGHARVSGKQHQRIKMDDKMSFFQQLATLVSSGTPLLESLRIAGQQNQSTRLRAILSDVAGRVAAGCSLHDAMAEYRHVFNDHWVELIRTGEMTGKMDLVLCDLNQQIRESGETRRKITGALLYPIILTIVAALVVSIMLGFVVPRFKEMFRDHPVEACL